MLRRIAYASVFVTAAVLLALSFITGRPTGTAANQQAGTRISGRVVIDFAGAPQLHDRTSIGFDVAVGSTAWAALQQGLGASSIQAVDGGGGIGAMITGFYGIVAQGNHFWEFLVNGKSSDAGVEQYVVQDGDVLQFRYASF